MSDKYTILYLYPCCNYEWSLNIVSSIVLPLDVIC